MKTLKLLSLLILIFIISNKIHAQGQWTFLNSGTNVPFGYVYFITDDIGFINKGNQTLLKTIDGGLNWNVISAHAVGNLFFQDTQNGIQGGSPIIKTTDGGITWHSVYTNPSVYNFIISFPNNNNGFAFGLTSSHDSLLLLKTKNGGDTWDTVSKTFFPDNMLPDIYCFQFTDSLHGYYGDDFYIYQTTDGGNTFIPNMSIPIDIITSICFPSKDTGFACSEANENVYKTIDAGVTWNTISYSFIGPLYSIYFTDNKHGCVVGGDGMNTMSLYQTNDCGNSWHVGATGIQTLYSVYFPDTTTGYAVGDNGTILKYSTTVGFNENHTNNNAIQIFPNPNNGNMRLSYNLPNNETGEFGIYDLTGRQVFSTSFKGGKNTLPINASELEAGVYLYRATAENKILGEDKIVVIK